MLKLHCVQQAMELGEKQQCLEQQEELKQEREAREELTKRLEQAKETARRMREEMELERLWAVAEETVKWEEGEARWVWKLQDLEPGWPKAVRASPVNMPTTVGYVARTNGKCSLLLMSVLVSSRKCL